MAEAKKNYVLKTFPDSTHEELLNGEFRELLEAYEARKYGVSLGQTQIDFIKNEIFPTMTWKGTECYIASAIVEMVNSLEANKVTLVERELLKVFYKALHEFTGKGIDLLEITGSTIETVAGTIKELNEVEAELRQASIELEAKKQGIEPETLNQNLNAPQAEVETSIESN